MFWEIVSYTFNTHKVSQKIERPLNQSLSLKRVQALSQVNGRTEFVLDVLNTSKTYGQSREKQQLLPTHRNSSKWIYRRFLEHASEEEFNFFCKKFRVDVEDSEYFNFALSEPLIGLIRENYIDYLLENINPEYPEMYLEKLNEHVENSKG
jgi:hypothetical protein